MGLDLGSSTFPFENPGDSVSGFILSITEIQATDMDTQEPQYWDAARTRPKMIAAVELQTELRTDAADDGRRTVHLAGNRFTAVKKVTKRIDEGGWLKLTFTRLSERDPAKKGYNRAKLFEAEYRAPAGEGFNLDTEPVHTPVSAPAVQHAYVAPTTPAPVAVNPALMNLTPEQLEMLQKLSR